MRLATVFRLSPFVAFQFFVFLFLNFPFASAQDSNDDCKVYLVNLKGTYKGDCKNGMANGQGEANGFHHYTGSFKNGFPNGEGTYYFKDSSYYKGVFQDGIREGKGEMHYTHTGKLDSVIKGYWSGDIYRGKRYITYKFDESGKFDRTEVISTAQSGNSITFEISTTSGSPGSSIPSGLGRVLSLVSLIAVNSTNIVKLSTKFESANTSYLTFEVSGFPILLQGTVSDGTTFDLELYKAADWKIRLFKNI